MKSLYVNLGVENVKKVKLHTTLQGSIGNTRKMKLESDSQCNHADGKIVIKIQWMPVIRTSSGIAYIQCYMYQACSYNRHSIVYNGYCS